jgi:hypothetical protein
MDSIHLIAGENQCFIEGKYPYPTTQDEILFNIAHSIGILGYPRLRQATLFALPFILTCFPIGICAILATIFGIIPALTFYEDLPLAALSLTGGIFVLGWGYFFFLVIYSASREHQYTKYLFNLLVTSKQLAQGQITEVTVLGINERMIHYSFRSALNREMIAGEYFTSLENNFLIGDEVTVLYLDKNVHVLL